MDKTFTCFLSLLFFVTLGYSQQLELLSAEILQSGQTLQRPFLGGLNAAQFNEADLDNDGDMDLVVFERSGDVLIPMLNGGTPNMVDYQYDPQFIDNFPEVRYWMMLRDFDGDGVMDLFTQAIQEFTLGVKVYKGKYVNNRLQFDPFIIGAGANPEMITFQDGTDREVIFVDVADYPALDDVDNDGDMDIITFRRTGGVVEWYKNTSVEMGYGRDSLIYVLEDDCYGGIFELESDDCPLLSSGPDDCAGLWVEEEAQTRALHPGSTLLTIDMDNDDDKELILGDLGFDNLVMLTNCNTIEEAWFCEVDCEFPDNSTPYFNPSFPASFWLDVNNDGNKDLLVSPNRLADSENRECVWFYENTGSNDLPVFELRDRSFLVGDMLDLGAGSAPAFVDVNADGLLDIIVGNESFYLPNGERDPRLFYYRNVGTVSAPRWLLDSDDWLRFSEITDNNDFALTPTFGDIDADGDLDLLVGESGGFLYFSENIGGAGNALRFVSIEKEWLSIDVGANSAPHFVDLNRDGKMDFLVGERTALDGFDQVGPINYFENKGTATTPMFNSTPDEQMLGDVNTNDLSNNYVGLSAPVVIEVAGNYRLVTGTGDGRLMVFDDISATPNSDFTLIAEKFGNYSFGASSRPAIADINNDGRLDVLVGTRRGGLQLFSTNLGEISVPNQNVFPDESILLFPNPADNWVRIETAMTGTFTYRLFTTTGVLVKKDQLDLGFSVADLPAGVYFVEIEQEGKKLTKRLVVQ